MAGYPKPRLPISFTPQKEQAPETKTLGPNSAVPQPPSAPPVAQKAPVAPIGQQQTTRPQIPRESVSQAVAGVVKPQAPSATQPASQQIERPQAVRHPLNSPQTQGASQLIPSGVVAAAQPRAPDSANVPAGAGTQSAWQRYQRPIGGTGFASSGQGFWEGSKLPEVNVPFDLISRLKDARFAAAQGPAGTPAPTSAEEANGVAMSSQLQPSAMAGLNMPVAGVTGQLTTDPGAAADASAASASTIPAQGRSSSEQAPVSSETAGTSASTVIGRGSRGLAVSDENLAEGETAQEGSSEENKPPMWDEFIADHPDGNLVEYQQWFMQKALDSRPPGSQATDIRGGYEAAVQEWQQETASPNGPTESFEDWLGRKANAYQNADYGTKIDDDLVAKLLNSRAGWTENEADGVVSDPWGGTWVEQGGVYVRKETRPGFDSRGLPLEGEEGQEFTTKPGRRYIRENGDWRPLTKEEIATRDAQKKADANKPSETDERLAAWEETAKNFPQFDSTALDERQRLNEQMIARETARTMRGSLAAAARSGMSPEYQMGQTAQIAEGGTAQQAQTRNQTEIAKTMGKFQADAQRAAAMLDAAKMAYAVAVSKEDREAASKMANTAMRMQAQIQQQMMAYENELKSPGIGDYILGGLGAVAGAVPGVASLFGGGSRGGNT